jgi:hypothetical protein
MLFLFQFIFNNFILLILSIDLIIAFIKIFFLYIFNLYKLSLKIKKLNLSNIAIFI